MIYAMQRLALAVGLGIGLGACFSEADGGDGASCPEGSEGCPCLDLQCEAGLACMDAICRLPVDGTGAATSGPSVTSGPQTSGDTTGDPPGTTGPSDSSGGSDLCGNGVLDPDELCDGTPGCADDCTFESKAWGCNPLNNAPCGKGYKCAFIEPIEGMVESLCLPIPTEPLTDAGAPPPGGWHESNCVYDTRPHDEWCDVGLACAYSSDVAGCGVNCCVEFCDKTDASFMCAAAGDTCQSFLVAGIADPGLEHLGYCITG